MFSPVHRHVSGTGGNDFLKQQYMKVALHHIYFVHTRQYVCSIMLLEVTKTIRVCVHRIIQ